MPTGFHRTSLIGSDRTVSVGSDDFQEVDQIGIYDTRDPKVFPRHDFRYIPIGFDRIL